VTDEDPRQTVLCLAAADQRLDRERDTRRCAEKLGESGHGNDVSREQGSGCGKFARLMPNFKNVSGAWGKMPGGTAPLQDRFLRSDKDDGRRGQLFQHRTKTFLSSRHPTLALRPDVQRGDDAAATSPMRRGARQSERRGTLERIRDPRLPLPGSFPQVLLAETRTVDFSGGARRGVFRGRLRLRRVRSLDPLNLKRIIPAKETARHPPAGCCFFRTGGAFRVGHLAS
jgi:hypothetical protein